MERERERERERELLLTYADSKAVVAMTHAGGCIDQTSIIGYTIQCYTFGLVCNAGKDDNGRELCVGTKACKREGKGFL